MINFLPSFFDLRRWRERDGQSTAKKSVCGKAEREGGAGRGVRAAEENISCKSYYHSGAHGPSSSSASVSRDAIRPF